MKARWRCEVGMRGGGVRQCEAGVCDVRWEVRGGVRWVCEEGCEVKVG